MKLCHIFPEAGAPQKAERISRELQSQAGLCIPEVGRDTVTEFVGFV